MFRAGISDSWSVKAFACFLAYMGMETTGSKVMRAISAESAQLAQEPRWG